MTTPNASVAIAILNYNSSSFLQHFLPTLIRYSPSWASIYIIDNASTDQSKQIVSTQFPEITWIQLQKNLGFAGGYYKGLHQIKEELVVLLNSDVEVSENWLPPLVARMQENEKLAAIQPKIKSYQNKDYFEHAGAAGGFIDYLGYPFCRGRIFTTVEQDQGQYDNFTNCFWASGACMLLRKSAYVEAGEFDPRFFLHMEEIDLCWRMQRCGYEIACEPASTVYHVGGGSLAYSNPKKMYFNFRNSHRMLVKNVHPISKQIPLRLQRVILDLVAMCRELITGKPKHAFEIAKALFTPWNFNPKQYNTTKQNRVNTIYERSIVAQYFLKGKTKFSTLPHEKFHYWR